DHRRAGHPAHEDGKEARGPAQALVPGTVAGRGARSVVGRRARAPRRLRRPRAHAGDGGMTASVSLLDGIEITRVGTGPPVVMVHGSAQGGRVSGQDYWRYQLPLADRGWELVLPSRPGHGPSPTRGPEDLEVDAVWVAELLGDGAHLVGHSYGAAIAMC